MSSRSLKFVMKVIFKQFLKAVSTYVKNWWLNRVECYWSLWPRNEKQSNLVFKGEEKKKFKLTRCVKITMAPGLEPKRGWIFKGIAAARNVDDRLTPTPRTLPATAHRFIWKCKHLTQVIERYFQSARNDSLPLSSRSLGSFLNTTVHPDLVGRTWLYLINLPKCWKQCLVNWR